MASDEADHSEERLAEALAKASWMRRDHLAASVTALVAIAVLNALGLAHSDMAGIFMAAVFVSCLNQPYPFLVRRIRNADLLFTWHLAFDVLAITAGLHFVGGVTALTMLLLYPLVLIYGGGLLNRLRTFALANFAGAACVGLVSAEHAGLIEAVDSFDAVIPSQSRLACVVLAWPLLNVVAHFAAEMSNSLRARESEVRARNLQLQEEIAERERTEQALRQAKAEAEAATRAKAAFLANMSHEIRTPMNGVIGLAGLLLDTELTREQRDYLKTLTSSANALMAILNDILDLSKIEAGKLDLEVIDFDLRLTVEEISDILAIRAQDKGLEFVCMVDPEVPSWVRGDPGRIRQVLANLIGNAVKFTSQGEIVVRVTAIAETEQHVTLRFEVADTGVGIAPDKLDSVFEAFNQADVSTTRQYGGTGLGLSIVRELAEMMGGETGVESESEQGSTFWFTAVLERLPVPDTDDFSEDLAESLKRTRILIVDDNATNRLVLTRLLASWGCRSDEAEGGGEALAKAIAGVEAGEPFQLALVDMQMPGMDGETFGRKVFEHDALRDMLLVVMTSVGQRGDVARLEEIGFAAYLTKPIKQSMLYDCLITVVNKRTVESSPHPPRIVTRHKVAEEKKRRTRILLAEDNPTNQLVALKILEKLGYRADAVANGFEVLRALEAVPYNLVLMDVQMPELDGLEATRRIRDASSRVRDHRVPVIAMTAHAMQGDREACLAAGMDDYVSKPVRPKELQEAIERQLALPGTEDGATKNGSREAASHEAVVERE